MINSKIQWIQKIWTVVNLADLQFQDRDLSYEVAAPTIRVRAHSNHVSPVTPPELKHMMLSPIKTSALNGENTGVRSRPLSTSFTLQLPDINLNEIEALRETSIEKVNLQITRVKNSWVIEDEIGFEPGDKLIAVNGTNVEDMDKENVTKVMKANAGNGTELILHVSDFLTN